MMIPMTTHRSTLLNDLPAVRGTYQPQVDLKKQVWFQVGGPAEILYKPADVADLQNFFRHLPSHIPWTRIGVGSNLLVRDKGVPGIVIKLGKNFNHITCDGEILHVGAAVLDRNVALTAQQHGLSGFEFMIGIPGTIGGAIAMNAGAYGQEVKDNLISCRVIDRQGNCHTLTNTDLCFSHRTSLLSNDVIVVDALFRGTPASPEAIHTQMERILKERAASQPIRSRTGGSTFKNPSGHKAWELIDQAGCRGLHHGGAMMSELHCNFMINNGNATAHDLETLATLVQQRVFDTSGILLDWEIKRIGEA